MKMKPEHYKVIESAILITANKNSGILSRARYEGWTQNRLAHDLLYTSKVNGESMSKWVCDNLYTYLDDSHIATAVNTVIRQHPELVLNNAYAN